MKIYRVILSGVIMTIIALGYVYQRVEIFQEGYGLQEKSRYLSGLQRDNAKLVYHLSKFESPKYLLASMGAEQIEFAGKRDQRTNVYCLARANSIQYNPAKENLMGKFMDLFTLNAEAETRN